MSTNGKASKQGMNWAANPRWAGVTRPYTPQDVERLLGSVRIEYTLARNGVLNGKGASLLDGYMEDLATDRIYRLMIAQRMRHNVNVLGDSGEMIAHTPELITRMFDEELERLLANPGKDLGSPETFREARRISEAMIRNEEFDPV